MSTSEANGIGDVWPSEGRLIAIDFGTVRIGLAICDPSRTFAGPLTTYHRRTLALDEQYFQKVVRDEGNVGWVLGLPIHCDGNESGKSYEVRQFAKWLAEITKLPIRFVDERFSTAMATRLMEPASFTKKQTKQRIDRVAAHVILESFLEMSRHDRPDTRPLEDRAP